MFRGAERKRFMYRRIFLAVIGRSSKNVDKTMLADYRKKNPPVHKAFAFRTPEHAVEDGYIRDKEAFASALKAELSRHDIHEKEVVFTLSSSKVVTREVMIPFVKDNKIMGIIEAQIRDYFPMDVSNYTISYSKMDVEEEDGKKMLKLLLVAIPDNLLNNYVTFAELAGLKVESEIFRSVGMMTSVLTPFECGSITKLYSKDRANKYFAHNMVVFFAGGTGHPYFSTDTATVLRAVEIEADGIYLAKAIDGVYDSDPKVNPSAKKYDQVSIQEVIDKKLAVVDLTASVMCMENHIPMYVFGLGETNSIVNAVNGQFNGTVVTVD